MMLQTQIEIEASPERVWTVLTDFERHPDWNPFIREIRGELRKGERIYVRLGPPGGRVMTFKPVVTDLELNRSLSWLGTLFASWIFAGEHQFRLEPIGGGSRTRFHHGERFSGILVPIMGRSLDRDIRDGFEQMNEALKAEAEKAVG